MKSLRRHWKMEFLLVFKWHSFIEKWQSLWERSLSCLVLLSWIIFLTFLLYLKADSGEKNKSGGKEERKTGDTDNATPSRSLSDQNLHIFTIIKQTCIASTATVKIGFVNQVSGEAIKYTSVKHDGCFLNRRSESPHVKAESDSEWQFQLCGDQHNCKQVGWGSDRAEESVCARFHRFSSSNEMCLN